jgi:hypothetical protein
MMPAHRGFLDMGLGQVRSDKAITAGYKYFQDKATSQYPAFLTGR